MTVFIAHHEADLEVAEALEKYLERRGHFVEREDIARSSTALQPRDIVVALWSKAAAAAPLERQAAGAALVVVKLDRTALPEDLRAAKSFDGAARSRREAAWAAVATAARDAQARAPEAAAESAAPTAAPKPRRRAGLVLTLLALLAAGAGAFAWARRDLLPEFHPDEAIARALEAL